MKNITQYFEDTVQSNNSITIHSNDDTKKETKYKKDSKQKRSYKEVKLTQMNVKEKLCDIVEKNGDMINKTLSTLAKVNNGNSNETYIESFSRGIRMNFKRSKLIHQSLDHLDLETNDFNVKNKKENKKDNLKICLNNNKKYKKELKTNINKDVSINNTLKNKEVIDNIELIDIDSNDKIENIREESNAFQILMSRNKTGQCISPIKLPQKEEINVKKSEEYKEKLKHSKEKLVALADKKGYSKRKLIEVEEGEKIEQMIQNRIKFFKGEDKKDNSISTTVLNHKQTTGSLLNYFSKTSGDLIHTNMANMSTIVVKADVHMTENSIKHELYKTNSSNKIQSSKKNKIAEFSQIDDIRIIESENINILNNKKKLQDEQQQNKHRWSLRIKLQTYEDKNASIGESSDDELFSPSTNKLNIKSCEKFKTKNVDLENLSIKNKSKKGISKQVNECTKSKLKSESSKLNDVIHDNKYLQNKPENKQKLIRLNKHESALIENENLNYNNINIENITENKQNQEDCILVHDNSLKRKTIDKLAPLFTKRKKPDPEVIAARRLFLQPDITDNNNKNVNRKVNVYGILPFPLISHVTQSSNLFSNETDIFTIPKKIFSNYDPIIDVNNFKHLIDLSKKKFKALGKVNKPKIQEVLMDIEKHCSNVKNMWSVISLIVKEQPNKIILTKTRSKKNKQSEKKTIEDSFESCSWTYKYRPKSSQEIVGNEEAVAKLKEWLLGWKAIFTNEDVSSGDEFYSSDSGSSKIIENNQVAILLGPHGCGKTASVYAVANEFGYTVLELNASSRRTGKKLLKELKEATKSHRIKKDEKISALCNLVSDEIIPKKIPQNSLILIEDVDIIFEEDEGFISATYQLATNTKRPIVMTCRDICPHLNKMAPQQNRIYFKNADSNRVSALIELISLAETGYRLPSNCITKLLQSGDMRKAILQLQYLLLSGPPQIIEQTINFKNSFWQNIRYYVYKPAMKVSKKWKKTTNNKVMNDDKNILIDVATKLDNIALLSSLIDIEDSALNLCQIKTQPNLSLIENTAPYSASTDMCLDIAEWIGNKIIYKDQLNDYDRTQYQNSIMLKKQLNEGLNLALSQTTSLLLDRQIIATDYLPSIRTICRAEELRANTNNKRGNRFFHYLHNLKTPSTLFKPNILAAACKIMYDKVDNDLCTEKNNTSFI